MSHDYIKKKLKSQIYELILGPKTQKKNFKVSPKLSGGED